MLVADTQRLFAEAVGWALLQYDGVRVVDEYPVTGSDAVRAAVEHRVDVALLDYWLPESDGPTATRMILRSVPTAKVLLLSWLHGPTQVQEAMAAGATGYLPKSIGLDVLVAAIRRAHAGEELVYGEELARMIEVIEARYMANVERGRKVLSLTQREVTVLQHLVEGDSLRDVAEKLKITTATAKKHLHNIVRKTGAATTEEAIQMAGQAVLISHAGPFDPPR